MPFRNTESLISPSAVGCVVAFSLGLLYRTEFRHPVNYFLELGHQIRMFDFGTKIEKSETDSKEDLNHVPFFPILFSSPFFPHRSHALVA